MLQRLSFVMSQKWGILMSQSVSFMTPQKLNKQFVTNSGFYNAQHVIAMSFSLKIILFHLLDFKNYQKIVLYTIFSRRLSYIITLGVSSGPVCATDVERILLQMLLRHDVRTIIG